MGGLPNQFNSCYDTVLSGRNDYTNIQNLISYRGNDTVTHYLESTGVINVTGSTSNNKQHRAYIWDGFLAYPYSYQDKSRGPGYFKETIPVVFDKHHALKYELSQDSLQFEWQRNIMLDIPLVPLEYRKDPGDTRTEQYQSRRFVEDRQTWLNLQLGEPQDSFGMKYQIPEGMTSLERLSGVPAYVGTAHYIGNFMWGGLEYLEVLGMNYRDDEEHRTYVDYDPVTGQAMRSGIRQQIMLRVERGSMFPNIISSQDRCVAPTRIFSGSSGLGCFAYYPIIWFEDAKLHNPQTHFNNIVHYYDRPFRAETLNTIGAVVGSVTFVAGVCLYIYESYHRRKFKARIYVD